MEEKVIIAKFGKTKVAQTEKQWRYNHGQKLKFEGVDLPANYEVHFSNSKTGAAKTMIGNADGVLIPQEYFVPGEMIYAWVYVEEDGVGVTRREVRIPIDQKAKPTDQQPLPEEQTIVEQAIEALNDAVNEIPNEITTALAEAKASGLYDGTNIWWIFTRIINGAPDYDAVGRKRDLNGKVGEEPLVSDLVYGPSIGSENTITDLYVIANINGPFIYLTHLDRIVGDDGFSPEVEIEQITNGHRVTITDAEGPESFDVMNGTFEVTGPLSMENYRLTELADGVDDTDAVNKAQVEHMIREGSGLFRGSFSTKASLNMASWQSEDPTQPYYVDNNDYCVVLSDETQHYECWRYGYVVGSGWAAQYRINEAPMTAAQIAAINSGITADRLVGLEQFKNTAQSKLNGIEAGAQVNKIEKIQVYDESTHTYNELPINNKTVDIPNNNGTPEITIFDFVLGYQTQFLVTKTIVVSAPVGNTVKMEIDSGKMVFARVTYQQAAGVEDDFNTYILPLDKYYYTSTVINNIRFTGPIKESSGKYKALSIYISLDFQQRLVWSVDNIVIDIPEEVAVFNCSIVNESITESPDPQSIRFAFENKKTVILNVDIRETSMSDEVERFYAYLTSCPSSLASIFEISNIVFLGILNENTYTISYNKSDEVWEYAVKKNIQIPDPDAASLYTVLGIDGSGETNWLPERFIVTVAHENNAYSANCTYDDIADVLDAGGIVEVLYNDYYFHYAGTFLTATLDVNEHLFICQTVGSTQRIGVLNNNTVVYGQFSCGSYSKPSDGIPANDLAEAVQTSLGKADTALQSYTETDPTVPSWAKESSKPSYSASEVGAVAVAQGVAHAGEFFVVGSDGNATTMTLATWQGGNY